MKDIKDKFYNTTNLRGLQLTMALKRVQKQNRRILAIFCINGDTPMTPYQVWKKYCTLYPEAPLTSIRRGINTLTNMDEPVLEKTSIKMPGGFGTPNYTWRLIT